MWWDTIVVGSGVRGATMEGTFGRRLELCGGLPEAPRGAV
jgi:hypothetical protein